MGGHNLLGDVFFNQENWGWRASKLLLPLAELSSSPESSFFLALPLSSESSDSSFPEKRIAKEGVKEKTNVKVPVQRPIAHVIYIYIMYLSMCTLFVHNLVTVPKLLLRLFFILFLIFLGFCCFLSVFPQSSALSQSGVAELIHGQFPGGRKIPYTQVNRLDMITIAAESSKDSSQFNKHNANIC